MPISTNPCIIFVFPVASEIVMINSDNPRRTVDLMSIPNVIRIPLITDMIAMAGMLSPMLASAEPNARFSEVCIRSFLAALTAARASGKSTIPAMITPTADLGAPTATTRYSTSFERSLAIKTTTPRLTISIKLLIHIFFLETLFFSFVFHSFFLRFVTGRYKKAPMPDRLHHRKS